jgi:hypothetical protein
VVPAPGAPVWPAQHWHHGPAVVVDVGFWWIIPFTPEPGPVYAYEPLPEPMPPPPGAPFAEAPFAATPPPDAGEPPHEMPPVLGELSLAPPDRYPVEERGFFDGDRLMLEAVVLDRATGEALWAKQIRRKADPRDARAVKEAVDALLSEGGWQAPSAD